MKKGEGDEEGCHPSWTERSQEAQCEDDPGTGTSHRGALEHTYSRGWNGGHLSAHSGLFPVLDGERGLAEETVIRILVWI